jgi:menaquinone-dependent protoporphyrinogen oxidase
VVNVLIIYGTWDGQSAKIADHIARAMRDQGHVVETFCAKQLPRDFSLDKFSAFIIGGSIRMGKYPTYVKSFVQKHIHRLAQMPGAFFSVCMAVRSKHPQGRQQARDYITRLLQETGWQPNMTVSFAGAVKYTKYNFITRFIMKKIAQKENANTDTSRDHEYTDWSKVDKFVADFLTMFDK